MSSRERNGSILRNRIFQIALAVVALGITLFFVFATVKFIGYGEVGIQTVWGAMATTGQNADGKAVLRPVLGEGVHFVKPFEEGVINVDVKVRTKTFNMTSTSSDQQSVATIAAVNYYPKPETVNYLYKEVGADWDSKVVSNNAEQAIKEVMGKYEQKDMTAHRDEIAQKAAQALQERLGQYHIAVVSVTLNNIDFSEEVNKTIEATAKAKQAITQANYEQELAKTQAETKRIEAKGEADKIAILNEQLRNSPDYVKFLQVNKWDGKLPMVVGSGSDSSLLVQVPN